MTAETNIIKRSSIQIEVTNRLRDEIVEGFWKPGMRLREQLLCQRFGISRSPLREAFQVLGAEKLLDDVATNRGAVVSAPTPSFILQSFTLLRALELLGVRLACEIADANQIEWIADADSTMKRCAESGDSHGFFRANNEFHRRIVLASGNTPLADAHLVTTRQIIRVQNLSGQLEHPFSEGVQQHDEIISAMMSRNGTLAQSLLEAHLDAAEENLRRRLSEFGLIFKNSG